MVSRRNSTDKEEEKEKEEEKKIGKSFNKEELKTKIAYEKQLMNEIILDERKQKAHAEIVAVFQILMMMPIFYVFFKVTSGMICLFLLIIDLMLTIA